jgi:hypothetical protein
MGWTSTNRRGRSVKDFLADEFKSDNWKIIDAAIVNRNEYYALIEYQRDAGMYPKGYRSVLVAMLKYAPRSYYDISYKDMDETMGPNIDNCPLRILDALADHPPGNEYAAAWRARCRAKHTKPRPKANQIVKFPNPILFGNGDKLDTFRYVKGSTFQAEPPGNRFVNYRITNWKDQDYTILPEAQA